MTRLPDDTDKLVDIVEYKMRIGEVDSDRVLFTPPEPTETAGEMKMTIQFSPTVEVVKKFYALKEDKAYISKNGIYVNCDGSGDPSQYVICMRDFGGSDVG